MEYEYPFFSHEDCPHFPCHEGVAPGEFNCLFCYCPLYALGSACGGRFRYTERGRKDCTPCELPHVRDNGTRMVKERYAQLAMLASRDADGDERTAQRGIEVAIMRHGATPSNDAHRYNGARTDEGLSGRGLEQARAAGSRDDVARVYVSPLRRARQTARECFPNAEQVVVEGLQEMDFGAFEGRSADEMEDDADYRAWVDGGCESACPGGESRAQFVSRGVSAVKGIVERALSLGEEHVVIVAHGGTIMTAFDAFSDDGRGYFDWQVGNCEGYRARAVVEDGELRFAGAERFADVGELP